MSIAILLVTSILLQLAASVLALRMIRITGWRVAWILIATGIALMALRRLITLAGLLFGALPVQHDLAAEIVALATSALLLVGVAAIGPLFRRAKAAEHEVVTRNNELILKTQELESVNRSLEAFSYAAAHDLRTPLVAIRGYSEVILRRSMLDGADPRSRDLLQRVIRSSERLDGLISALLDFCRSKDAKIERQQVDLSALARSILDELCGQDDTTETEVQVQPDLAASGDPALLRQVVENLLCNAWKYSRQAQRPKIAFGRTEYRGREAFYVCDNGIGFDEAEADMLFEPFQRLPGAAGTTGMGLGLAIARRIIRRHGGEIWAEGQPGRGATFYWTLSPGAAPEPPVVAP